MTSCPTNGLIPRDQRFSNLSIQRKTVSQSVTTTDLRVLDRNHVVTWIEQPGISGTYLIAPFEKYTVFRFSQPIQQNQNLYFTVDSSQSQIGDQIVFLFRSARSGVTNVYIPTPPFYLTACGGHVVTIGIPANGRMAQTFIFDGSEWVYTGDNC